ncbi:hypothetical protein [Streptococcus ruminantium]|uniref:hypothetical protein n=1 Tax=Streptococcus ruminantium TaxID=1917441 RepID=UPI0012DCE422|nr:hypothetical protein [Streptococcus ruminantium]
MKLEALNNELSALTKKSKNTFDIKSEADNKGNHNSKNPFGLDLKLLGGSRPRFI